MVVIYRVYIGNLHCNIMVALNCLDLCNCVASFAILIYNSISYYIDCDEYNNIIFVHRQAISTYWKPCTNTNSTGVHIKWSWALLVAGRAVGISRASCRWTVPSRCTSNRRLVFAQYCPITCTRFPSNTSDPWTHLSRSTLTCAWSVTSE